MLQHLGIGIDPARGIGTSSEDLLADPRALLQLRRVEDPKERFVGHAIEFLTEMSG
jgi:hypothetical protein